LGDKIILVVSDWDGICVGESGSPALRLLLMGCVDVEGSSKHAKLIS
jgi:hypothetical protein